MMVLSFLTLAVSATSTLFLNSLLLSSSNTPELLLTELSEFPKIYNISSKSFEEIESDLVREDFLFFIDITFQPIFYPLLDSLALHFDTFYFSLSSANLDFYSSTRFNLHGSYKQQGNAIETLIKFLNWTSFSIISSDEHNDLKLSEYMISKSNLILDLHSTYSQAISQNDSDKFIGRILKANRLRKIVILDKNKSFDKVQNSINSKNFAVDGNFFISISESIYSANIDGSLIVVEAGLEDAVNSDNYHHIAIMKALSNLSASLSNISNIQKNTVYETAKILYPSHTTCTSYSLVNVHNQDKKIVGEIEEDKLRISSTIYYPGNTTNPLVGKAKIVISIANTSTEIFNLYNYTYFSQINDGAVYAMDESNRHNDIEGYYVSLFPTGCGIFLYDPGWFNSCYSKVINDMGIAYIDSFWYTATYGDLVTLRSLGNVIPQVSYLGGSPILDNSQEFPEFLRITMNLQGFTTSMSIFLNAMKWNYPCYITDMGKSFLDIIINIYETFNVYFANSLESMLFPPKYSREEFEKYKSRFQAIKDSKCVIIAILVGNILPYLEALYDVGLRKGDVYIVSYLDSIEQLNTKDEEIYENKWYEIGENSLKITPKLWIGEFGNKVKTEMTKYFPKTTQDYCLAYDTFNVIKSAIQYTLSMGDNIEDPTTLMKNIRAAKIIGCSGNIMFDSSTNSVLNAATLLSQAQKNQITGQYYSLPVVSIDRFSHQIVTYENNFTWGSLMPLDTRPDNVCPFEPYLIEDFPRGIEIFCAFCVFFIIISLLPSYYSFKFFNRYYTIDKEKKIVSISDIIFISYFFLQYFQLVTLGPKYDSINSTLYILEVRLSGNLMNYYNFSYSKFWIYYKALLILCSTWTFGCLGVFLLFKRMQNNVLTNHILPMIGQMLFIPLFSMLLDIYTCKQSISGSLADSFFEFDCTNFCYSNRHLVHLILGSLVATGFLVASIYSKCLWEITQISLHLTTNPKYMYLFTIFQVTIVCTSKILSNVDETLNGCAVCFLIGIMIVFTYCFEPYNDDRMKIIQLISLACSFSGVLVSTLFLIYPFERLFGLLKIGSLVSIIALGLTSARKVESCIFFEKNKNISAIIHNFFTNLQDSSTRNE